jgi:hypothetical protein
MKVGTTQQNFQAAVADGIPCPFMATMVKEGRLQVAPDGAVQFDQLRDALKLVGIDFATREVLARGTQATEKDRLTRAGQLVKGSEITSFDITKLTETNLMHTGDLKVRRGGFTQEKLDWLLSFSSDGKGLSLSDLSRAQADAVKKDPGVKGHLTGMVEISALLRLFGTPNAQGEKSLTNDALTALFRDNRFPDGWQPKKVALTNIFANMAGIAFHQVFTTTGRAAAGLDKALERASPLDQSGVTSLGRAICPAGMRPATPPVNKAEALSMHNAE